MDQEIKITGKQMLREIEDLRQKIAEMAITQKQLTWAKERLKESREHFQRLSEATDEGILIHNKGKIISVNKTFADMFGYSITELIGTDGLRLIVPAVPPKQPRS